MSQSPSWFPCYDCKGHSNEYIVPDAIWIQAMPNYRQLRNELRQSTGEGHVRLCFECLEKRLGRRLTIKDFPDFPINGGVRLGFQLGMAHPLALVAPL